MSRGRAGRLAWPPIVGGALGLFAAYGDYLPIDSPLIVLVAMANAVGPWVVAAFGVGTRGQTARDGAILGVASLLVAVIVYYLVGTLVIGNAFVDPVRATVVWAAVAVVVGIPIGAAGATWRTEAGAKRSLAVGALAGVLLAEAISRFVEVEGWTGYDISRTALQVATVDGGAAAAAVLFLARDRATTAGIAAGIGAAGGALLAFLPLVRSAAAG